MPIDKLIVSYRMVIYFVRKPVCIYHNSHQMHKTFVYHYVAKRDVKKGRQLHFYCECCSQVQCFVYKPGKNQLKYIWFSYYEIVDKIHILRWVNTASAHNDWFYNNFVNTYYCWKWCRYKRYIMTTHANLVIWEIVVSFALRYRKFK